MQQPHLAEFDTTVEGGLASVTRIKRQTAKGKVLGNGILVLELDGSARGSSKAIDQQQKLPCSS